MTPGVYNPSVKMLSDGSIVVLKSGKYKVTTERWMNIYTQYEETFRSKSAADSADYNNDRIACVKLTGTYTVESEE